MEGRDVSFVESEVSMGYLGGDREKVHSWELRRGIWACCVHLVEERMHYLSGERVQQGGCGLQAEP